MGYIAIIDYGAGNLMSVHNSLDFLGYENQIADTPEKIKRAQGVILPGVGAFGDAAEYRITAICIRSRAGKTFSRRLSGYAALV